MTNSSKQDTNGKGGKSAVQTGSIPRSVAHLMATCFVNAGRLEEAEQLLQRRGLVEDGGSLRYELGLVYAGQGQLDKALGQFKRCLKQQPQAAKARRAALQLLQTQAGQAVTRQDWDGAAHALQEALKLNPDDQQLHHYLQAVQEALPAHYLAQGQPEKAAQFWEETQRADPANYQVAHQLAILYHRRAIELEQAGQSQAADDYWPRAIANWVLLIEADPFWKLWTADRETIYGRSIEAGDIETLRYKGLPERLTQIHRDFQTQNGQRAEQHKQYRLQLNLELKTAKALRQTARLLHQRGKSVQIPVYAGPLMLEQLGLLPTAQQMANLACRLEPKAEPAQNLALYLSPLGRLCLLIEQRQTDQAIDQLKQLIKQEPRNNQARQLLVLAFKEAGRGLAPTDVQQALATWAEGLKHAPDNTELKELITQTSLERAAQLQKDKPDEAIKLLKLGLDYVPGNRAVQQKLANSLNQRGVQHTRQGRWEQAIADLKEALRYQPHNRQFKKNLGAIYNGQGVQRVKEAIELARKGRPSQAENKFVEAIALLEQAVQVAPAEAAFKQNLADAKRAKGLIHLGPARGRQSAARSDAALFTLMEMLAAAASDPKARQRLADICNAEGVKLANEASRLGIYHRQQACNNLSQAKELLEVGLQYNPSDRLLQTNLRRVRDLQRQMRC